MSENPIMVEETLNSVIRKTGFKMQQMPTADKKEASTTAQDAGVAVSSGISKVANKLNKYAAGVKNEKAQKFLQAMAGTAGTASSGVGKVAEFAVKAGIKAASVGAAAGSEIQRTRSKPATWAQDKLGKNKNNFW